MALSVPPAVNYQSPLNALPVKWDRTPSEGSKIIPCEVDWGTMGGPNNCVSFNLQNNATLNFSQIVALSIDNSVCGSDIEFIFSDTTETLSIPAYAPKTIVPVFTNQTQFWLSCPSARSEDITRFSILNSMPPPIAVPTTQEQTTASASSIDITVTGSIQIVATTINGTLENISIDGNLYANATGGEVSWQMVDGNSVVIAQGGQIGNLNSWNYFNALTLNDVRLRFQGGLKFQWTTLHVGAGQYDVNLYYRTP
jgi:hypothetical protein